MSAVTSSAPCSSKDDREIKKTITVLQSRSRSCQKDIRSIHKSPIDENVKDIAGSRAAEVNKSNLQPESAEKNIPKRIPINNSQLASSKDSKLPKIIVRNYRNRSESPKKKQEQISIQPIYIQLLKPSSKKLTIDHISFPNNSHKKSNYYSVYMADGISGRHNLTPPCQSNTDKMIDIDNNLVDSYKRRSRLSSLSNGHTAEWPANHRDKVTSDHLNIGHNFSFAMPQEDKSRDLSITFQKADDSVFNASRSKFDQKRVKSNADLNYSQVQGNLRVSCNSDMLTPKSMAGIQMQVGIPSRGYSNILEPLIGSNSKHLSSPRDTSDNNQKMLVKELFENSVALSHSVSQNNQNREILCNVLEERDSEGMSSPMLKMKMKYPKIEKNTKKLLKLPDDMIKKISKEHKDDHLGIIKKRKKELFAIAKVEKMHPKGLDTLMLNQASNYKANMNNELALNTPASIQHNRSIQQHYLSPSSAKFNSPDIERRKKSFNAKINLFEKVNSSSVSINISRDSSFYE